MTPEEKFELITRNLQEHTKDEILMKVRDQLQVSRRVTFAARPPRCRCCRSPALYHLFRLREHQCSQDTHAQRHVLVALNLHRAHLQRTRRRVFTAGAQGARCQDLLGHRHHRQAAPCLLCAHVQGALEAPSAEPRHDSAVKGYGGAQEDNDRARRLTPPHLHTFRSPTFSAPAAR